MFTLDVPDAASPLVPQVLKAGHHLSAKAYVMYPELFVSLALATEPVYVPTHSSRATWLQKKAERSISPIAYISAFKCAAPTLTAAGTVETPVERETKTTL
jgi:hypothetical protein